MAQNEAAQNVERMKAQIGERLKVNEKPELKTQLDAIHSDNREKVVSWSKRERNAFVKELREDGSSNKKILAKIQNEIDNELFETRADVTVPDWEGHDKFGIDLDRNKARRTVEQSWADNTKDLEPEQKKGLADKVMEKLEIAHEDKTDEIFEDVGDRFGIMNDKMVTQAEADAIKTFIVSESVKLRKANQAEAPEATPPKTAPVEASETPAQRTTATEAELRKIKIETGFEANAQNKFPQSPPEDNKALLKKIVEHEQWKTMLGRVTPIIEKYQIDGKTFETALANFIGQKPEWLVNTTFGVLSGVNKKNKQKLETNLATFDKYFSAEANKTQIKTFFNLKGIGNYKNNPDMLVRYFAFNDVAEDIKTFNEWKEAREAQEQPNQALPEVKLAEAEIKITTPSEDQKPADEKSLVDQVTAGFEKSMSCFKEAFAEFKNGKWKAGFSKILEALFVDGVWESSKDTIAKIPFFGLMIVAARTAKEKNGAATATPETTSEPPENLKKAEPILKFLGIEQKDAKKIDELKKFTVTGLLAANPSQFEQFKKNHEQINLSDKQLTDLQNKMKEKTIEDTDKTKNVFDLLVEKSELLN